MQPPGRVATAGPGAERRNFCCRVQAQVPEPTREQSRYGGGVVKAAHRRWSPAVGTAPVSTVASCLVESGIVLGVLPMGTLNHFAKDLHIPLSLDEAVANIATGGVRAVDVGKVNRRTFINNSSLGLASRHRARARTAPAPARSRQMAGVAGGQHRRSSPLPAAIGMDRTRRTGLRTTNPFCLCRKQPVHHARFRDRRTLYARWRHVGALHDAQHRSLRPAAPGPPCAFKRLDQARDFDEACAQDFIVQTQHRKREVATDGEVTEMETPLRYRVRPKKALRVIVPAERDAMKTLVHLSDSAFRPNRSPSSRRACAAGGSPAPDLLVVSGDLTQRARPRGSTRRAAFLDASPRPQIVVPGNHDVPLYNVWERFVQPFTSIGVSSTLISSPSMPT